jgi:hypothetical protein
MVSKYSSLFDIKRLLGAMKKDAMNLIPTDPLKKQIYYDLFNKLKNVAISTKTEYMVEWCNDQVKEIRIQDLFD